MARDPGQSRAKIAVISKDSSIDPVGACVGMRGVRVQAVVQELQGERIDIIPWSGRSGNLHRQPPSAPAEVITKVVLDEDTHRVEVGVVVPGRATSLHLPARPECPPASQLTGWQIDILTEAEESETPLVGTASPPAPRCSANHWMRTRPRSCWPPKALPPSRTWLMSNPTSLPDRGFRPGDGAGMGEPRHRIHRGPQQGNGRRRKALGVEDPPETEVEGVTPGPNGRGLGRRRHQDSWKIRRWCATDDLLGWYETGKDKERVRMPGALEGFDLTSDDANAVIMKARVKIG